MDSRLQDEIGKPIKSLNERINEFQTRHNADLSQIASLNNEIKTLREELSQQIATVRASVPRDMTNDVTSLRSDVDRNSDEHRTVMLNNHGLLQPITFSGVQDKLHRDIIITRVSKNNVVGYVLTPNGGAAPISADQN